MSRMDEKKSARQHDDRQKNESIRAESFVFARRPCGNGLRSSENLCYAGAVAGRKMGGGRHHPFSPFANPVPSASSLRDDNCDDAADVVLLAPACVTVEGRRPP